jgi:hypothetical protein
MEVAVHIFWMRSSILNAWMGGYGGHAFLFGWMDEGGWRPNLLTKLWLIIRNINS